MAQLRGRAGLPGRRAPAAPRRRRAVSGPQGERELPAAPGAARGDRNRITVERMRYNEVAQAYNTARLRFPTNLSRHVGFKEKAYFKATTPGAERAPDVKFDFRLRRRRPRPEAESEDGNRKTGNGLDMSRFGSRIAFLFAIVALVSASALGQASVDAEIPEKPAKYVTDRAGILGTERVDALSLSSSSSSGKRPTRSSSGWTGSCPSASPSRTSPFAPRRSGRPGRGQRQRGGPLRFRGRPETADRGGLRSRGCDPRRHREADHRRRDRSRFRSDDYPGGIEAGVNALMAAAKGEYKGSGSTVDERSRKRRSELSGCTSPPSSSFSSSCSRFWRDRDPASAGARSAGAAGGPGWAGGRRFGGWSSGGGGGGWSGGGGGGGGFSGGGGSFGGGGASGSW